MSGLAEILDENTALRRELVAQGEVLRAQGEQLVERERQLADKGEVLRAQGEQLVERERQLADKDDVLEKLQAKFASLERRANHLEEQLLLIEKKRELAKAERFIAAENQTVLFEDADLQLPPRDAELQSGEDDKDDDEPNDRRRKPRSKGGHPRRGRRKLGSKDIKLPKTTVRVPVGEVPGGEVVAKSSTTSWRVEFVPAKLMLIETIREQKTRADGTTWTAQEPFLLPRAMCGDGLLAHVITEKFEDHLPLNRQAKRFARQGLSFGTNVLSGWLLQGFEQVRPLVRALCHQVVQEQLVLSDDTGHPVQDRGDGQLRKGRFWVFTDQRQAFYAFSEDKKGIRPKMLLEEFGFEGGTLIADGGSEYDLAEASLDLTRGGCWSHFRRYFTNAAALHEQAKLILPAFQDLFLIERQLAQLSADDRLAARQERSAPLVEGIYTFITKLGPTLRPGSLLAKACGYGLSQQSRMQLFLADGRVPLHNNLSELLLRQPVVGRKNWTFSRSTGGAIAAAAWYSLIASAKLQGLVPGAYLYDVFKRLPSHPANRVGELTPLNWRLAVEAGTLKPLEWGEFLA